jgi:hypothetical protein
VGVSGRGIEADVEGEGKKGKERERCANGGRFGDGEELARGDDDDGR